MSTLIGMPAPAVDLRRFPFAAAVLSGDAISARYAAEAERAVETEALIGNKGPGVFSASWELRQIAAAIRRHLTPTAKSTLVGIGAFPTEQSLPAHLRWPNVASRLD